MKHFHNLKYHLEKFDPKKVGHILLHSKSFKTINKINEDKSYKLSKLNSFDGKIKNRTLFKEYENLNKKNNFSFSDILNKSKNKSDLMNLSRNYNKNKNEKEFPFTKKSYYTNKRFNKSSCNDNKLSIIIDEKKSKSLLFEKFPSLSEDMYNLKRLYKNRDIFRKKMDFTNKMIIKIPENNSEFSFRKNIDMKIKILKIIEKTNILKKKLKKKVFYELGEKEYNNIKKVIENRDYNLDIKTENDPFKKLQNEYKKNFKRLKKEFNFYPYNYLEEHKNIDTKAFEFMVNNFNSNFSLFGSDKMPTTKNKTFYKKKEISKINKPSIIYINRIKRMKSKEGRDKSKFNL